MMGPLKFKLNSGPQHKTRQTCREQESDKESRSSSKPNIVSAHKGST